MSVTKHEVKFEIRKRVPLAVRPGQMATGFTTVPDGFMIGEVRVSVDHERLAKLLGPRAIKSKGRRAVLAGGIVCVEAFGSPRRVQS